MCISYMCKWVEEQELGEITKKAKLTMERK